MSDPTGSSGIYGVGGHWVRWAAFDRNDVQTQYSTDLAELAVLYRRWKTAGDGRVTASRDVRKHLTIDPTPREER